MAYHLTSSKKIIGRRAIMYTLAALTAVSACITSFTASSEPAYPTKAVRIVVGFPAGGAGDILARMMAEKLSGVYGQPFVVENRAGAGGTVGAAYVARAKPDGYTLLLGVTASQTIASSIYKKLAYDPINDFSPVATLATIPVVLVANPAVEANTPGELVQLAKQKDPSLSYASSGVGAIPHLTGALFAQSQNIDMLHVPFQGSAPALADLLAGRVDIMFDHLPSSLPSIKAGTLKALGVAGDRRAEALSDVPTLSESGIDDVVVSSWFALLAPATTPSSIVNRLNADINQQLNTPEVKKAIAALGAEPFATSPNEFDDIIRQDTKKWGKVVKESSIQLN